MGGLNNIDICFKKRRRTLYLEVELKMGMCYFLLLLLDRETVSVATDPFK